MEIYAVIENNFDDERIQFYFDFEKAESDFKELKKDFDPMISIGGVLIQIKGEGTLYLGRDIDGSDDIIVIDDFDEYTE